MQAKWIRYCIVTILVLLPKFVFADTGLSSFIEYTGEAANDYAGFTTVTGDVNGDGYDDILIGAHSNDDGGNAAGAVYLVYGKAGNLAASSLSTRVEFTGEAAGDNAGSSLATGDINGDGYDDILIGAPANSDAGSAAGAIYIIYGKASNLSSGSLSARIELTGEYTSDNAGTALATGDVNGDGYDDILIGADFYDDAGSKVGAAYLVYGQSSHLTAGSLSAWVVFRGEATSDYAGSAVAAGDLNGDGYDDILVGAPYNDDGAQSAGAIYLIYGKSSLLESGSLTARIEFTGEASYDHAGSFLATGDVNNDGYEDLIIGASAKGATATGAAYLIYGKASNLSSGSLSTRIEFTGEADGDNAGTAVVTGDVNNDGYADIVIGAPGNDDSVTGAGATYLIYGKASNLSAGSLTGRTEFTGEGNGDDAGSAIAIGDMNGDDFMDVLIGADQNDDAASIAGAAYLGYLYIDVDGDGVAGTAGILANGSDCNDSDSTVSANQTYYRDADGDGYGISTTTTSTCSATAPTGYVSNSSDSNDSDYDNDGSVTGVDCDDTDSTIYSNQTYYRDADSDGLGNAAVTTSTCSLTPPSGYVINSSDTNDTVASGDSDNDDDGVDVDSDCNDADATISTNQTYYRDADGDGYGSSTVVTAVCSTTTPTGYVSNDDDTNDNDYDNDGSETGTDCNDLDANIFATQIYYRDADSDGLGSATVTISACSPTPPTGYVVNASDTNDNVASGDSDNDDDGVVVGTDCNDADATISTNQTYYRDADGDGYGSSTVTISICATTTPSGYVTNSSDTNDSDYDNDGTITSADCDDTDSTLTTNQTYYQDSDGDGLGNAAVSTTACSTTPPSGYVINSSDTNDTVASGDSDNDDDGVDATSDCNDADATVSEYQTYYQDADGDGYGNADLTTSACSSIAPSGYVANDSDTDDTDSSITYGDISFVAGTSNGDILVTYSDDSIQQYDIFTVTTTKDTVVVPVPDTTLVVAVHPKARKIALVNALSGEVLSQKKLNGKSHSKVKLLVKDLRSDDKYEAVVVAKRGTKTVHVDLFSIKVAKLKLKLRDETMVKHKKILPSKTKAKKRHIKLRRQNGKVVQEYTVNKKYKLTGN